jgi:hypothetical protein
MSKAHSCNPNFHKKKLKLKINKFRHPYEISDLMQNSPLFMDKSDS